MVQHIIENALRKDNWSSIKFSTQTSSKLLFSNDVYSIDPFCIYIQSEGKMYVLDLQNIVSMEIRYKKEENVVPLDVDLHLI